MNTVRYDIVEKVAYLTDSTNGKEAGTTVTAGSAANGNFARIQPSTKKFPIVDFRLLISDT